MITSPHNSKIQVVRALLGRPRERRDASAFVAEGVRLLEEALAASWPIRFVLAGEDSSPRGETLLREFENRKIDVERVAGNILSSITETEKSQGIIAVLENSPLHLPSRLDFVLIPDQIRDPGNLGTLLRTAAAAGVQAVLLPPETTDAFAPKVIRSGMGAHFHLPIHSMMWEEIQELTRGSVIFLAEMETGTSCWQADFSGPLALIVGGEAEGASQPARKLADQHVFIPMPGQTESLNAAVAGAILMFEVVRQRNPGMQPISAK